MLEFYDDNDNDDNKVSENNIRKNCYTSKILFAFVIATVVCVCVCVEQ